MTKRTTEGNEEEGEKLPSSDSESSGNSTDNDEQTEENPIPEQVLERLPPQMREQVTQMGRTTNPIAAKITPEHIGELINNDEKQSQRENSFFKKRALVCFCVHLPGCDCFLCLISDSWGRGPRAV